MAKVEFNLEFADKQISYDDILKLAKDKWKADGNKATDLKKLELYIKPEESKTYYVANSEVNGEFDI